MGIAVSTLYVDNIVMKASNKALECPFPLYPTVPCDLNPDPMPHSANSLYSSSKEPESCLKRA